MSVFEEVLRYLGWRGQALDSKLRGEVEAAIGEAGALASPRHIWRVFPLEGNAVAGTGLVLSGEAIGAVLAGAGHAALMAATLGQPVDNAMSR
jgi:hypothetical protein